MTVDWLYQLIPIEIADDILDVCSDRTKKALSNNFGSSRNIGTNNFTTKTTNALIKKLIARNYWLKL